MLSKACRQKLRDAFARGVLRVRSVSPVGIMSWEQVTAVQRAEVYGEIICEITMRDSTLVLTGGHRVFVSPTEKMEAESLRPGQHVLTVQEDQVGTMPVMSVKRLPARQFMYDLTTYPWHNFVLSASSVTISNSPDRNYHFRPPTHEGTIGCYNQVFGYIWEDDELLEYLNITLDKWNMQPPETEELCTLDAVCQKKPAWKAALLWGAVVHAAMALSFNWVADEFSVSGATVSKVLLPDGREVQLSMAELYDICHECADG